MCCEYDSFLKNNLSNFSLILSFYSSNSLEFKMKKIIETKVLETVSANCDDFEPLTQLFLRMMILYHSYITKNRKHQLQVSAARWHDGSHICSGNFYLVKNYNFSHNSYSTEARKNKLRFEIHRNIDFFYTCMCGSKDKILP